MKKCLCEVPICYPLDGRCGLGIQPASCKTKSLKLTNDMHKLDID